MNQETIEKYREDIQKSQDGRVALPVDDLSDLLNAEDDYASLLRVAAELREKADGSESKLTATRERIKKAIGLLASGDGDGWDDGMKILFPLAGLGEFVPPVGTPCLLADLAARIERDGA